MRAHALSQNCAVHTRNDEREANETIAIYTLFALDVTKEKISPRLSSPMHTKKDLTDVHSTCEHFLFLFFCLWFSQRIYFVFEAHSAKGHILFYRFPWLLRFSAFSLSWTPDTETDQTKQKCFFIPTRPSTRFNTKKGKDLIAMKWWREKIRNLFRVDSQTVLCLTTVNVQQEQNQNKQKKP